MAKTFGTYAVAPASVAKAGLMTVVFKFVVLLALAIGGLIALGPSLLSPRNTW